MRRGVLAVARVSQDGNHCTGTGLLVWLSRASAQPTREISPTLERQSHTIILNILPVTGDMTSDEVTMELFLQYFSILEFDFSGFSDCA